MTRIGGPEDPPRRGYERKEIGVRVGRRRRSGRARRHDEPRKGHRCAGEIRHVDKRVDAARASLARPHGEPYFVAAWGGGQSRKDLVVEVASGRAVQSEPEREAPRFGDSSLGVEDGGEDVDVGRWLIPAVAAALRSAGRAGSVTLKAIANAPLPRLSANGATLTWSGTSEFATRPPDRIVQARCLCAGRLPLLGVLCEHPDRARTWASWPATSTWMRWKPPSALCGPVRTRGDSRHCSASSLPTWSSGSLSTTARPPVFSAIARRNRDRTSRPRLRVRLDPPRRS